jgi:hypothetical protein
MNVLSVVDLTYSLHQVVTSSSLHVAEKITIIAGIWVLLDIMIVAIVFVLSVPGNKP